MYSINRKVLLPAFIALVALMVAGKASTEATLAPPVCKQMGVYASPSCLSESDIAPCKTLLAKNLPHYIDWEMKQLKINQDRGDQERTGWFQHDLDAINGSSSPLLAYALQVPPYKPLYGLTDTKYFIKSTKQVIAILKSGDENKMDAVIGKVYRGQEFDERLAGDEMFMCMLNVRLAQCSGPVVSAKFSKACSY